MTLEHIPDRALRWTELGIGLMATAFLVGVHSMVVAHAGALWRDEVASVNLANLPSLQAIWSHTHLDSFPILWPTLLHGWVSVGLGETDFGLRVLGLIFGMGVVAALWWNSRLFGYRVPLISLALFAMSPTVFRFGDSLRAYGLTALLLLLLLGAVWKVVEDPKPRRVAIFVLLSILTVQSMYPSSMFFFAMCAGGCAVCLRHRNWRTAGILVGTGLLCAISLLPYLKTFARYGEWAPLIRQSVSMDVFWGKFDQALRPDGGLGDGEWMIWLWLALFLAVLGVCAYRLFGAGSSASAKQKDLALYIATTMLASVICYSLYLKVFGYVTFMWYYLLPMAILAVGFEVALQPLIHARRTARIGLLALFSGFIVWHAADIWRAAHAPLTNIDRVAATLESVSDEDDFIVLTRFHVGAVFERYYAGRAAWMTLPHSEVQHFTALDVFKQKMTEPDPIRPVLDRITQTLQSGHRVWVVGRLLVPAPGKEIEPLPPAPAGPRGWHMAPYRSLWWAQTGSLLQARATELRGPSAMLAGPVIENLPLMVASGWRRVN